MASSQVSAPALQERVAVIGLGYVGLPTCLTLVAAGAKVIGVDVSRGRLAAIAASDVDLPESDRLALRRALRDGMLTLVDDLAGVKPCPRAVIVCVPTPVDDHFVPDLTPLAAACEVVVASADDGQVIVLSSTSYVGTTRDLLVRPLEARGFALGSDVFVAFSPERIDPGSRFPQHKVPRVVGGVTAECGVRAAELLGQLAEQVHNVDSPEAAELTKLYENTFRAVNVALANELADIAEAYGLDSAEVIEAASTKPYGFMAFRPGPGVGGHCIPVDPHYLLWKARSRGVHPPLIGQAMSSLALRPGRMVERLAEDLSNAGVVVRGAKLLFVGAAYKPGVSDVRCSPAAAMIGHLLDRGAHVSLFDPLVGLLHLPDGTALLADADPDNVDVYDCVVVHTIHPGVDYAWLADARQVFDLTFGFGISEQAKAVRQGAV